MYEKAIKYLEEAGFSESDIFPLGQFPKLTFSSIIKQYLAKDKQFEKYVLLLDDIKTTQTMVEIAEKLENNPHVVLYSLIVLSNGADIKLLIDDENLAMACEIIEDKQNIANKFLQK